MDKTVTIRMDKEVYEKIANVSKRENRPISNFIETATLRYLEELEFTDDVEVADILSNQELVKRLRQGHQDMKLRKGRFVC